MNLTPNEIVRELYRFIIGQTEEKRSGATALQHSCNMMCLGEEFS